jgi:hypothetical protein
MRKPLNRDTALVVIGVALFILYLLPKPLFKSTTVDQSRAAEPSAFDTTLKSAYALCSWVDSTKLLSEKCKVSSWHSTVEMSINMPVNEAQNCTTLPKSMAGIVNWSFEPGWQLKIFSPYSGERPIASCDLAEMAESARQQASGAASSPSLTNRPGWVTAPPTR